MAFDFDKYDLKILGLLQNNARISVKEISRKISLSPNAVSNRIARMENAGCIDRYAAILNKSVFNKNLECFAGFRLAENNSESMINFTEHINKIPEVYNYYQVNERFDFLIHFVSKDMQDYHRCLTQTLSKIKGVCNITSFFVLSEMKGAHKIDLSHL